MSRKHSMGQSTSAPSMTGRVSSNRTVDKHQAARDAHKINKNILLNISPSEESTQARNSFTTRSGKVIPSSRFIAYVPETPTPIDSAAVPAAADCGAGPAAIFDEPVSQDEEAVAPLPYEADSLEEDDEEYVVLYCEHFDFGDGSMADFCVRRYPESNGVDRYTVTVGCVFDSAEEPVLLWDVWSSVAFEWIPPAPELLPRSSGGLEVDCSRRCVVSRFSNRLPGRDRWQVVLEWPGSLGRADAARASSLGQSGRPTAPRGISAQILYSKNKVLRHPCGQCFVVPVRGELDVAAALPVAFAAVPALMPQSITDEGPVPSIQLQLWDGSHNEEPLSQADPHSADSESTGLKSGFVEKEKVQALEMKLSDEQAHRRRLLEELMNLKSRIRVFCRVRGGPIAGKEAGVFCDYPSRVYLTSLRRSFQFDLAFGPETDTSEIFLEARPLVDSVIDRRGASACVLCYGQTGAGKTFTMEGPSDSSVVGGTRRQRGLIDQTIEHIYARVAEAHRGEAPQIGVSMIEIYQEQPFDLLHERDTETAEGASGAAGPPPRVPLVLRSSSKVQSAPVVPGLVVAKPATEAEAIDLYRDAVQARRVGSSERNAQSSRSHLLLTLHLQWPGEGAPEGRLALVDLAGSERQSSSSLHDRRRIDEARAINRSLTTLAKVVRECGARRAPSKERQASSETRQSHISYRDSVLTRLLCDCIGGASRTLFIVHASPEECDVPETVCTLQFGTSAKRVRTQQECAQCKGGRSQRRIDRLSEDNDRLRRELVLERRRVRRLCHALPEAEQVWNKMRSPRHPESMGSSSSPDQGHKEGRGQASSDVSSHLDHLSLGSLSPPFGSESPRSPLSNDMTPSPDKIDGRRRSRITSLPAQSRRNKEGTSKSPSSARTKTSARDAYKENRGRHPEVHKSTDKIGKENNVCCAKLPSSSKHIDVKEFRPALREVSAA